MIGSYLRSPCDHDHKIIALLLLLFLLVDKVVAFGTIHRRALARSTREGPLRMGGYYVEPNDKNPLKFDHMVFGVPCLERKIELPEPIMEDNNFVVLDVVGKEDSNTNNKDEKTEEITLRLAKYLMKNRADLVEQRKIVVLGSNWIPLLLTRMGATSVLVWDNTPDDDSADYDENMKRVEAGLRVLQYTDQFVMSSTTTTTRIQTTTRGENLICSSEFFDADVVIMTTASFLDDPWICDDLRKTDAMILMDEESMNLYCYHARIQEGADILVW